MWARAQPDRLLGECCRSSMLFVGAYCTLFTLSESGPHASKNRGSPARRAMEAYRSSYFPDHHSEGFEAARTGEQGRRGRLSEGGERGARRWRDPPSDDVLSDTE